MLRLFGRRAAIASAAGASTAAAAATIRTASECEGTTATAAPVPPFVLGGDRYDQSSFIGRLYKIQELIDMRTILTSDDELAAAQARLAEFKKLGGKPEGVSDAQMWAAGLLMSKSIPTTLFWQWWNQTYNVVNNYVNRAGPTVEYGPLAQSYALAVTASCSIAIGAGKLLAAYPSLQTLGPFVPYLAVITAGTCNVGFTRMDEMRNGIDIADADGAVIGRSVAAGKLAVFKTVTTRSMFLPIFPLVIPPLVMKGAAAAGLVAAGSTAAMLLELATITLCMSVGLPAALALQPTQMELDVSGLEPEFQGLKTAGGEPVLHVYASKGL